MNIETIETEIGKLKTTIAEVEQLISDYKTCQSSISKKVIEAAIVKYSTPILSKSN